MKKFNKIFPILILVILIIATFVLCSCDFSSTNNNRNNTNNEQSNSDDNNTGNNNGKNNNSGNNNGEGDNSNNNGQTPLEEEPVIEVTEGLEYVYLSESNSYKVSGFTAPDDNKIKVTIPESYNDVANGEHPVTSIGEGAFSNCSSLKSITIPSSVTSIGEDAFSECNSLTSITIPDSVTSIGEYAFYGCSKLESITLPFVGGSAKTESDFYQYPFGYIFGTSSYEGGIATEQYYYGSSTSSETSDYYYIPSSLKDVTITGGNILCGAFSHCSSLTSITILDSVTSIGFGAFFWCSNLTSIEIPSSVTSIGFSAFEGCNNIETANIPTIAISYIPKSKLKTVVLNSGTSIDDYAFYGCSNLTSITIPSSVTSIGGRAFSGCDSLTSIEIPSSVTSIEDYAFYECSNLTSITIPSSVTSIGSSAFYNCRNLTRVDVSNIESWLNISFSDFHSNPLSYAKLYINDEEVTTIVIPDTITEIKRLAFYGCNWLSSITIPNSVTSIGESAFFGGFNLTSIIIPSSVISIGFNAFSFCFNLTSIAVDENNPVYDSRNNCNAIIETATNTLVLGIKNTIIPDTVTSIGSYAFFECSNLTSITIPSSVTSIEYGAFGAGKLVEVYNKSNIDLTEIDDEGFNKYGLDYVKNIYTVEGGSKLTKTDDGFVIYTDGDIKELISYEGISTEITIPNDVTSIGLLAFFCNINLTNITIPSSVTSIGSEAFSGCNNLQYNEYEGIKYLGNATNPYLYLAEVIDKTQTTYTIHNDTKIIGEYAFFRCSNLTNIVIPNTVTSIGSEAFWGCNNLQYNECEGLNYLGNATNPYLYLASVMDETQTTYTINDNTTIIGEAFAYCGNLISITIPSSVISIGMHAFFECFRLIEVYNKSTIDLTEKYGGYYNKYGLNFVKNIYTEENGSKLRKEGDFVIYADGTLKELISYEGTSIEITIPSSVTGIWSFAFDGCSNLTSITIPSSVTSIGDYAFSGCSNLTSITIPSSVTSMGNGVFFGCRNLRSITILSSITSIGDYAFYECSNLTSITIPSSVRSIGEQAFYYCSWLTSITFGENSQLTSIESHAFFSCDRLTSITIPSSVTSIGYEAFYNCSNLTSITIPSSVTSIRPWAFDGCSSLTIYCEATSEPSGWDSKWYDSNRPVYWYSETAPTGSGNYWHYVEDVITIWE